jgi:uncharacterized protein
MACAIITAFTPTTAVWISADPKPCTVRISVMPAKSASSALYEGWVMHRRLSPRHHAFRYRVFAMLLDLDELHGLSRRLRLFAWNKAGILSFHDRDHGDGRDLRAWLESVLAANGIVAAGPKRVLCYPRLFGYVFNPLSVWFCHAEDGGLAGVVYEVHNTFGERHAYVLRADGDDTIIRQYCAKDFYVSPFLSQDCTYDFKIRPPLDDVLIAIGEKEAGAPVLTATFSGKRKPLTDASLFLMLLRHPLMTLKIIAAIHFEAVRLMWKGVPRHAHA